MGINWIHLKCSSRSNMCWPAFHHSQNKHKPQQEGLVQAMMGKEGIYTDSSLRQNAAQ